MKHIVQIQERFVYLWHNQSIYCMKHDRREKLRIAGEDVKGHRHSSNPFTENWQPPTALRSKKVDLAKRRCTDEKGAKLEGKLLVPYERDSGRFVKIAHESLQDLTNLSSTAISVLAFAMHQALAKNLIVWMDQAECSAWCRFKQPKSYYDGVMELILYEYIARTERIGFYYINPQKFSNGDRTKAKNNFSKPKIKSE